jgi:hypothetical protein
MRFLPAAASHPMAGMARGGETSRSLTCPNISLQQSRHSALHEAPRRNGTIPLLVPEQDDVLRAIPQLKDRLRINVELASPADFIPVLRDGRRDPFTSIAAGD